MQLVKNISVNDILEDGVVEGLRYIILKSEFSLNGYIETHGFTESAIKDIRIHCKNDIDLFNSFVPVVATLEEKHLKAWMRISYYMNAIIAERETTQDSVLKIIEKIQLFDDESFRKKLVVD